MSGNQKNTNTLLDELSKVYPSLTQEQKDHLNLALYESITKDVTTIEDNPFTINDFVKLSKKISDMKPIAISIEMSLNGYWKIKNNINCISEEFKKECNTLFGVNMIIVHNDEELKYNQGRIKFSNGDKKIINIHK